MTKLHQAKMMVLSFMNANRLASALSLYFCCAGVVVSNMLREHNEHTGCIHQTNRKW